MEPLTGSFDTSSEPYPFISESLKIEATHIADETIRGTRSVSKEMMREGTETVTGTVLLNPSPADLDLLLPRILGAAESMDSFALAETLPTFGVMIDRVAQVFTYASCYVNRATFRSQSGGFLELELDVIGTSESVGAAGSFPALTLGVAANNAFYTHEDAVVTLVSSARDTGSVEIVIDNHLLAKFNNSQTATDITPQSRTITLKTTHPYTAGETDLYGQALAGAAGSVVYTNGGMSTTFTFANLKVPDRSPVVGGKNEIPLELEMMAYKSGSTENLIVTHDSVA